ncbi:hypothetical protein KO481_22645 [Nocardia sp. NEAU-G5]|uniref:Uncharacterized protein n=1 Tax=Nocardia albiluteola TaxID=2842303 RepID=A0ABS6B532_9NOCA|nr:hypothetical protein [Nocardia albiluteola]MBU3064319.1 hypothetical protein [Nocardia albiluteola]
MRYAGKPGTGSLLRPDPPEQVAALAQEAHAAELARLEALRSHQVRTSIVEPTR